MVWRDRWGDRSQAEEAARQRQDHDALVCSQPEPKSGAAAATANEAASAAGAAAGAAARAAKAAAPKAKAAKAAAPKAKAAAAPAAGGSAQQGNAAQEDSTEGVVEAAVRLRETFRDEQQRSSARP